MHALALVFVVHICEQSRRWVRVVQLPVLLPDMQLVLLKPDLQLGSFCVLADLNTATFLIASELVAYVELRRAYNVPSLLGGRGQLLRTAQLLHLLLVSNYVLP